MRTRICNIVMGISVLFILINLGGKVMIISRQAKTISNLQQKTEEARRQSAKLPARPEATVEQKIRMIIKKIPTVFTLSEYSATLRSLMDRYSLSTDNDISFAGEKIPYSFLQAYNTKFSVFGTYPDIKQFIADVQNLEGLNHFNSVTIQRDEDRSGMIRMNVDLSVYFKRENHEI